MTAARQRAPRDISIKLLVRVTRWYGMFMLKMVFLRARKNFYNHKHSLKTLF